MNWKQLTIGKKISIGFGIVIILLVVLGGLSFTGVGGIVKNASEVIDGKALDGELAQKEVDHLNWIGEVNKLLTDENVTKLTIQTDHTQCGFGKWLYGKGRKEAEAQVPSLAPLFKEIEEPHRLLHESAIDIDKAFTAADPALPGFIANKLIDHLEWTAKIQEALLENASAIEVQTDHTLCAFGKWLYSDAAAKTAASDVTLEDLMEQIKASHKQLHDSAKKIIKFYRQVHTGLRNTLRLRLDDHRRWAAEVSKGIITQTPFHVELNPEKCNFGKWLTSNGTARINAEDERLKDIFNQVKQPHKKLHESALTIKNLINSGNIQAAASVFNSETQGCLKAVSDFFEQAIGYEEKLMKGREKAIEIFQTESLPALNETKELLNKFQNQAQTLLEGQYKAFAIYGNQTAPNLKKVQHLLGELRQEVKKNMLTDKAMLDAATATKRNVAIIAVVAIVAGVLLAFVIARGIISVLTRISNGLGEGADQVAAAASEVSSSSQSMAEGSSQQAASIEETSSSMEEMASMTKRNAENATHADTLMKESNGVVAGANKSMAQLTQSMEDISKASEETSKIIKTIDEIAFQTNLLALNAAVEAARAGEAGAGFAVVADEVRNLAMRAADAAKDTAELIGGTVKKVNEGSSIAVATNEAFNHVTESSQKVARLVAEISEASKEQSRGISQVNTAIAEMDCVVQKNAANAEESASAAEELSAQAEQLKNFVDDLVVLVTGNKNSNRSFEADPPVKKFSAKPKSLSSNLKKLMNP
ncbi:methyl-accepting chemotaxis protein [Desulfobacter curvatus]|uniref:methyl-accepting chemotaxis protein n=1 Tax=Desulfobacter curvatus TaxID=2290 RepID=UPI00035D1907|nr:methyl-accepting chemotaxis protein [Desulfobacter curvatus]